MRIANFGLAPHYYHAVTKQMGFTSADEIKIDSMTKKAFRCGNVTLKDYSEMHSDDGWKLRKILALPVCLFGLASSITNLAFSILFLPLNLLINGPSFVREQCFRTARDFEVDLGCFLTLFNDRLGSYFIEDGRFHQKYYDCGSNYTVALAPGETIKINERPEVYAQLPILIMNEEQIIPYFPNKLGMDELNKKRFALLNPAYVEQKASTWKDPYLRQLAGLDQPPT